MGCAPVARARGNSVKRVNSRPVTTTVEQTVEGGTVKSITRPSILKNASGFSTHLSGRSNSANGKPPVTFTSLPPKVLGSEQTRDSTQIHSGQMNGQATSTQQQQDFPAVQMTTSVTPRVTMQSQPPQPAVSNTEPNLFFSFQEQDSGKPNSMRQTGTMGTTQGSMGFNQQPQTQAQVQNQGQVQLYESKLQPVLEQPVMPYPQQQQPKQSQVYQLSPVNISQQLGLRPRVQSPHFQQVAQMAADPQSMRHCYTEILQITRSIKEGQTQPKHPRKSPFPQSK